MAQVHTTKGRLLFFSFVGAHYSRSSTILNSKSDIFEKIFVSLPMSALKCSVKIMQLRNEIQNAEFLIVMSPCHVVTPVLKFLTGKKVILDAGWSLTDGQLSRSKSVRHLVKLFKTYVVDFFAFHAADLVIVESHNQAIRTARLFGIKSNKIKVNFTGLDETIFREIEHDSQTMLQLNADLDNLNFSFIVLFRGKINNESGIENILEAAKILEDKVAFVLVCGEKDVVATSSKNVIRLTNLTNSEMSYVYHRSDVTLGQTSSHPRLRYTIPHKAFESGYFSKPYITANSIGIRELYELESVIVLDDISGETIADQIIELMNQDLRLKKSNLIHANYQRKASQQILSNRFEEILLELNRINGINFRTH